MRTIIDVLIAAKARIDKPQKWCKEDYAIGGRVCALGALKVAVGKDPKEGFKSKTRTLEARAAKRLEKELPYGYAALFDFNDADTTRHRDVMALFDRAIASSTTEAQR